MAGAGKDCDINILLSQMGDQQSYALRRRKSRRGKVRRNDKKLEHYIVLFEQAATKRVLVLALFSANHIFEHITRVRKISFPRKIITAGFPGISFQ